MSLIDFPLHSASSSKAMWTSPDRLYLDKSGNVVGAKDPNRVKLLVAAGGQLPLEDAKRYGLVEGGADSAPSKSADDTDSGQAASERVEAENSFQPPVATLLPDDFPARDILTAAGFDSLEAIASATDDELLAVKGIGKATVRQIREA